MTSFANLKIAKRQLPLSIGEISPGRGRILAIGDCHGCLEELLELIGLLDLKPEDVVVFLGDYVDRGPYSGATVDFIREMCVLRPGTYAVLGNHDEKHARARRHLSLKQADPDYVVPMKKFFGDGKRAAEHASISDAGCAWIAKLPTVVAMERRTEGEPRIFTHAGLIWPAGEGWKSAAKQETKALIRNRYVRLVAPTLEGLASGKEGRYIHVQPDRGPNGEYLQPRGTEIWDEVWEGPRVISGHMVHDLKDIRVMNDCYGIDTGCCFGGFLTAYQEDLATSKVDIVQVKAREAYAVHKGSEI